MSTATESIADLIGLIPGFYPHRDTGGATFNEEQAERACDFFEQYLTHVKGKWGGKPIMLERWQKAVIANTFGWIRPDGTRRFREVFFYVPRKNGKTVVGAGLALYLLLCDGEKGAEIYSAAADREQARLCFEMAKGMVTNDETLSEQARPYRNAIVVEGTLSNYKAVSADAHTKHGGSPHGVLFDELHAQPNRDLVDVFATGMGARRQPLMVYMTTADFDRPSICNEKYEYACKVRDGKVSDPAFLPVVYEASNKDDWKDPKTWAKANPNLGVSVSREFLERECLRAQEVPGYLNTFKRLHLNMRTGQDTTWITLDAWDRCGQTYSPESLRGRECIAGLDLGSTSDLTALCLTFPETDGEGRQIWRNLWWHWCPEKTARDRERAGNGQLYETWAHGGHIELTPGNEIDYAHIHKRIGEIAVDYQIMEIAVDRLFQGAQLSQDLIGDGFNVVTFGMGFYSMAAPAKEFEEATSGGRYLHNNNPVMRWQIGHLSCRRDAAGNAKPDKETSRAKIDGVVAGHMALGRALVSNIGKAPSITILDSSDTTEEQDGAWEYA